MDIKNMTEQIINGRRLTENDDLGFLLNTELDVLTECADKLRKHFSGPPITVRVSKNMLFLISIRSYLNVSVMKDRAYTALRSLPQDAD